MKRLLFLTSLLVAGLMTSTLAQSGQSPTIQQSTSTENTRQANPPKPKRTRMDRQKSMSVDTTQPKNRKQRRLAPDSLRRGGATRVDTVRR